MRPMEFFFSDIFHFYFQYAYVRPISRSLGNQGCQLVHFREHNLSPASIATVSCSSMRFSSIASSVVKVVGDWVALQKMSERCSSNLWCPTWSWTYLIYVLTDCSLPGVSTRGTWSCSWEYEDEKKDCKSIFNIIPKWSEWDGVLGDIVEIFKIRIPYVRTKLMWRFGIRVEEFGREPAREMKGSSIPCWILNHSMECFFRPLLLKKSWREWFASSMRMIACCCCCNSSINLLRQWIAFEQGQKTETGGRPSFFGGVCTKSFFVHIQTWYRC